MKIKVKLPVITIFNIQTLRLLNRGNAAFSSVVVRVVSIHDE